ncbi:MAG: hypothetical protein ACFFDI_25300 [Promethearchaeota archaeon]
MVVAAHGLPGPGPPVFVDQVPRDAGPGLLPGLFTAALPGFNHPTDPADSPDSTITGRCAVPGRRAVPAYGFRRTVCPVPGLA